MASTQHQAEQLLQETAEAQQANLALKGIHDLRGLLEAVGRDRVLQPIYLDGVASSLEVNLAPPPPPPPLPPSRWSLLIGTF